MCVCVLRRPRHYDQPSPSDKMVDAVRAATALKSQKIEDHYELGKVIGTGTFAMVKLCRRKSDNMEFAVKIFDKR